MTLEHAMLSPESNEASKCYLRPFLRLHERKSALVSIIHHGKACAEIGVLTTVACFAVCRDADALMFV